MVNINIPGYKVISSLGEGGMSSVYLAEQLSFGRFVALKVLTANRAETEHFGARFLREARIAAHLTHPNIVQVFDTGSIDGNYYLAMEYLPGGDLKQRIKSGIPLLETLEIVKSIADAIDYASERDVIHRDIKPANIMFREDGTVCLVDFGIARDLTSDTEVTQAGAVLGTPRYMSPEQALGKELDLRSDLYSLGVVFYELLSGTAPFTGGSAAAVGIQHVSEEVPPLPVDMFLFQEVIDTVMEKEPAHRYESGKHFNWAIDEIRQIMPEELSTTILLSQPSDNLKDAAASGISGTRSRRKKLATRNGKSGDLDMRRLRQFSVALVCTLLVALGVLLFPYLETGTREISAGPKAAKTPEPKEVVPSTSATEEGELEARDSLAASTLEQARIALEDGRTESATALIDLIKNIGPLSADLQAEMVNVISLRESVVEKKALTESLAYEVNQMISQSALLLPPSANAFEALNRLRDVAPEYRELPSLERRITSAASLKIQDRIDRGQLRQAGLLIAEFEQFVSSELINPLRQSLTSSQNRLEDTRSQLRKLEGQADALVVPAGNDVGKRRELTEIYLQILALKSDDRAANIALKALISAELADGKTALAATEIKKALESADYLAAKFAEHEGVSEFSSAVMQRQQRRENALGHLASAQQMFQDIETYNLSDESMASQREVVALHIEALRAIDRGLQSDNALAGLLPLANELVESYKSRFGYYQSKERSELLQVYQQALEDSGIAGFGVPDLSAEFARQMAPTKKSKRRFPTPTF